VVKSPVRNWSGTTLARLLTLLAVLAGVTAMHVLATVTGPGHGHPAVSPHVVSASALTHGHGSESMDAAAGGDLEVSSGDRGGEHGAMGACTLFTATGLVLLGALLAAAASAARRGWFTVPDPSRLIFPSHAYRGPPGRRWPRVALCVIRV